MLRSLFGRGRKKRRDAPGGPPLDESIRAARTGDVVSISGLSPEYEDRYFFIERVHRYSSAADTWYELLCVDGDTRLWVDWTDGYDLSVTITEDSGPSGLNRTGLDEEDLIRLDEEHSIDNYVTIDGDDYHYRNSAETLFFQDNRGAGDAFYQWDFIREQGDRVLAVSKWEGKPFEVVFSEVISPDLITLYKGARPDS